jgi:hypothetical protein
MEKPTLRSRDNACGLMFDVEEEEEEEEEEEGILTQLRMKLRLKFIDLLKNGSLNITTDTHLIKTRNFYLKHFSVTTTFNGVQT